MRARWLVLGMLVIFPLLAQATPTAILVDTSRSIPPAQFESLKGSLEAALPDLVSKGPVALYAFNDEPVKLVDYTTDQGALRGGIQKLAEGGRFTLLYDCLFTAEKDMAAQGPSGVILLLTDGRDENSAVTLEDFAARASEAHVAVVSVGLGATEEKTLRRLAVLTGGRYAGILGKGDAASFVSAWRETEAALPPPPPPKAEVIQKSQPAVAAAPVPPPPADHSGLWILAVVFLAGFAIVVVVLVVLLRRTKPPEARVCETCGRALQAWEAQCPDCLASELAITKPGVDPQTPAAPPLPEIDPALLRKGPPSEALEHTLVLDEVPVLVLRRGNNPPRMFQLPPGQVVSIGRDKVNTISVADQTLSAQHFRIVQKEGKFYLVDLQSTNGTYLDNARVTLAELGSGAVIRAGQCEFTFRLEMKKLS